MGKCELLIKIPTRWGPGGADEVELTGHETLVFDVPDADYGVIL